MTDSQKTKAGLPVPVLAMAALFLAAPIVLPINWQRRADARLTASTASALQNETGGAPRATATESEYCSQTLHTILRRVLQSCGLIGASGRGCQPVDARNVAPMSGDDFNALFLPMQERGAIVQFERDAAVLDPSDLQSIDRIFSDRRGASYFFVVSRASPEGSAEHNRELSEARARAVVDHIHQSFQDPELDNQIGMLWLGEEYAQLDQRFCQWNRSNGGDCNQNDLNRSAFIAWIDCRPD